MIAVYVNVVLNFNQGEKNEYSNKNVCKCVGNVCINGSGSGER